MLNHIMDHLISDISERIQNNLYTIQTNTNSIMNFWINLGFLILVLGAFIYFLYSSYNPKWAEKSENKNIPFTPVVWGNAVKNVPTLDYGQIPATEVGNTVSGYADRTSSAAF